MEKDTGGNAFPTAAVYDSEKGMTLRDYFAAKAMQSLIASMEYSVHCRDTLATDAYWIADAMLKARNA